MTDNGNGLTAVDLAMTEIWLPVVGYEENYQVSNFGRVRVAKRRKGSRDVGYILKINPDDHGYPCIWLWLNGKKKRCKVHHLVASAFIGIRPVAFELNHIDGVRNNNHVDNLEWVSRTDNAYHAYRVLGRKGASAKLTSEQVVQMRSQYAIGGITMRELGEEYDVGVATVHNAIHGVTWKYIQEVNDGIRS